MSKYVNNSAIPGQNEYTIKILTDTDKSHTIKILIGHWQIAFQNVLIYTRLNQKKKTATYFLHL